MKEMNIDKVNKYKWRR